MRKTGLVAAGLALTLTLVGCGSKEAGTPTAQDNKGTGESSFFSSALDLANTVGDKSKTKQSAKMAFDIGAGNESVKGTGAFSQDGTDVKFQMSMEMPGMGTMDMILINKVIYMKLPDSMKQSSGLAKPWVKITEDGKDPLSKALSGSMAGIEDSADVGKALQKIKDAGEITKTSDETLDGQKVKHYWITLDVKKMAAVSSATEKKSLEEAEKLGIKTMDMELWVNQENLPVKITMKIPAGGQTAEIKMTYSDWGAPVDIKAPANDQIGTLPGN
jgi:hypothetical protein